MFEPAQRIGPYELLRPLGAGAFGEVWLARHLDLNEERALKIPVADECIRQLRKEGVIQHKLHHPNIVPTLDLNTWNDPPYFAMEFVEGQSLRQRLVQEGRLPVEDALRILKEILAGLHAAHTQGVLHRDLKPENVLLAADGTAKVADFGIGRLQAETAQSLLLSHSVTTADGKSISGTIEYMSPQQKRGGEATPGDDLYAVGIIACELLTGEKPQLGISVEELFEEAELDAALARVVRRALARPQRRFQTASEMAEAIEGGAAGAPAPSQAPLVPRPAARPCPPQAAPADLITNSIGMKLKLIQPGRFTMGEGSNAHQVTLSKPFYLGIYPVTQAEYERVIGSNPAHFKGPNRPVEQASWDDAQQFCRKLTEMEGAEYRLPTEAEWEYACRAGTTTAFCFGDTLSADTQANCDGNCPYGGGPKGLYRQETTPVGSFPANPWGLHDMHGNVWEWCQSLDQPYPYRADDGREGLGADGERVLRGGSWYEYAGYCRSADRDSGTPDYRGYYVGFRVARPLP